MSLWPRERQGHGIRCALGSVAPSPFTRVVEGCRPCPLLCAPNHIRHMVASACWLRPLDLEATILPQHDFPRAGLSGLQASLWCVRVSKRNLCTTTLIGVVTFFRTSSWLSFMSYIVSGETHVISFGLGAGMLCTVNFLGALSWIFMYLPAEVRRCAHWLQRGIVSSVFYLFYI